MFKFIRKNGYTIIKLIISQLGMTMFGLVLSLATYQNTGLLVLTSIFAICFYLVMLYAMAHDGGLKDEIRVSGGREKAMPLKGLYMGLVANAFNIILGLLCCIGFLFITNMSQQEPLWAYNMFYIPKYIATVAEGMYGGLLGEFILTPLSENPDLQLSFWRDALPYLLIVIPGLVASALGYFLGLKNIRLLRYIIGDRADNLTRRS